MAKYADLFNKGFDMIGDHKKITIWKAYHNEEQINKYGLFENERIYLFNCANTGYEGKCINQLNQIICEGCCLLYPYLNNLKSDIIGFQHYKRWFVSNYDRLKIDEIKSGKVQVFYSHECTKWDESVNNEKYINIANHYWYWGSYFNGFYNDIIEFMENNYPEYLEIEKNVHIFFNFNIFVCNWDNYTKIAKFIWDYLNFIANKYKFNIYNDNDWAEYIKEYFIDYNYKNKVKSRFIINRDDYYGFKNWISEPYKSENSFKYSLYRIFSFHIEFIVSMLAYNIGYVFDDDNKLRII